MEACDYKAGESLVAIQGTGWINNHCSVPSDNGHSHIPLPGEQPLSSHPANPLPPRVCFDIHTTL